MDDDHRGGRRLPPGGAEGNEAADDGPATGTGIAAWRHRSGAGAIAAAALLGIGDALEGRRVRERPAIIVDDPGEPVDPDALVEVELEEGSPLATWVRLRRPPSPG
jgi:hypothetical protein